MTSRPLAALLVLCCAVVAVQQRALSISDVPPCQKATIALIDPVTSANAQAGDFFRFRIADDAVSPDGIFIPKGNIGYGIVATASHAQRGGVPGYVALEPRFIQLANGREIPVIADRRTDGAAAAAGASRNIPGIAGAIPFAGYLLGPYGYLHHGTDVTVQVGTRLVVLLGNDVARGDCRIPKAGEIVAPATVAPSPAGTPSSEPSPGTSGAPAPGDTTPAVAAPPTEPPIPAAPTDSPAQTPEPAAT